MANPCLMFAGQSVQESGMGLQLWKLPAARRILERLKPALGADLEEITTAMGEAELALTVNAQRAIHACHLGNWFAYKAAHPGLELEGVLGHSMGIVAALVAAEAISVEDSGAFMRARAEAFSRVCKGFPAPMGLAAVSTEFLGDWRPRIEAFPGVSLALHNTIGRGVIGGRISDLEAFAKHAQSEGWPVRVALLKVEGPYHTEAFASCRDALAEVLRSVAISKPAVAVYMGTSGKREDDPERIRLLLAQQADSPELHFDAVWAAYDAGARSFLEIAQKPQPVTWIPEQLQDEDGRLMPGVTATAVKTSELL